MHCSSGSIYLDGEDIAGLSAERVSQRGVGRSYQRTTIFPEFSVFENARLSAQAAHARPWVVWEAARGCAHSTGVAREALAAAGLVNKADHIAGALSHGGKRQLEIAMCLATRPQVLLLDEPLAGMGAEETERMLALLQDLKREHAVLLVEHDMDAVFSLADQLTVMVNGQVIASGTPTDVRSDANVQAAYLGEEHA